MKNETINLKAVKALSKLCGKETTFGIDKIKLDGIHATATNEVGLARVAILREPLATPVVLQPEQLLKPAITISAPVVALPGLQGVRGEWRLVPIPLHWLPWHVCRPA